MLKLWVANTDYRWFSYLSNAPGIDEVNFWQPSGRDNFRAISEGELFLFKLKSPYNAIGGYGERELAARELMEICNDRDAQV